MPLMAQWLQGPNVVPGKQDRRLQWRGRAGVSPASQNLRQERTFYTGDLTTTAGVAKTSKALNLFRAMIVVDNMNRPMTITHGLILTLSAATAFGQAPAARPEFEVASIRPSARASEGGSVQVGLHIDGAMIRINYLNLKDYIAMAYNLKLYQVTAPDWVGSDAERFDISAKLPEGSKRDDVGKMLQNLLEDRFQLKVHLDTKEFPVFALVVGKGGFKLKESAPGETDTAPGNINVGASGGRGGVSVNLGNGAIFGFANNQLEAKKLTMTSFTDTLSRFMDRPVVDMTDLSGHYDFAVKLTDEDYHAMLIRSALAAGVNLPPEALRVLDNASDESLVSGLDALGLKLERRKEPLPVLVVDHMEKAPSSN
jgi:uncharacterized protein (TIGR03435 family)